MLSDRPPISCPVTYRPGITWPSSSSACMAWLTLTPPKVRKKPRKPFSAQYGPCCRSNLIRCPGFRLKSGSSFRIPLIEGSHFHPGNHNGVINIAENRSVRFVVETVAVLVDPEKRLAQRAPHLLHVIRPFELIQSRFIVEIRAVYRECSHACEPGVSAKCKVDSVACPAACMRSAIHEPGHPPRVDFDSKSVSQSIVFPDSLSSARTAAGYSDIGIVQMHYFFLFVFRSFRSISDTLNLTICLISTYGIGLSIGNWTVPFEIL